MAPIRHDPGMAPIRHDPGSRPSSGRCGPGSTPCGRWCRRIGA